MIWYSHSTVSIVLIGCFWSGGPSETPKRYCGKFGGVAKCGTNHEEVRIAFGSRAAGSVGISQPDTLPILRPSRFDALNP
jgi:hypothetical protein